MTIHPMIWKEAEDKKILMLTSWRHMRKSQAISKVAIEFMNLEPKTSAQNFVSIHEVGVEVFYRINENSDRGD